MATKNATVLITGQTPLLMHAFPLVPVEALDKKPKEEQAELSAYRNAEGQLYIPGVNLQRALIGGATYSKGKGKATLQKTVAACVFVFPERLLMDPQSYVVDSRPIVVPATKGRVLRHRPRFDNWQLTAEIEWDDTLLTAEQIRRVIDDTGKLVGLGDFRPEKKGPYGRFIVDSWKVAK